MDPDDFYMGNRLDGNDEGKRLVDNEVVGSLGNHVQHPTLMFILAGRESPPLSLELTVLDAACEAKCMAEK